MGIFKGKEIFTIKPWLTDYKQNVEQLKKILGLSSDNMLPAIEEGDEGKVVGVSSGKYALIEGGGGSSDFSTAEVTITTNDENVGLTGYADGILIGFAISQNHDELVLRIGSPANTPTTWDVVLWDGTCSFIPNVDPSSIAVTVSGNIEYNDGEFFISGDGTVTITAQ